MVRPISPDLAPKVHDKMFRHTGNITVLVLAVLLVLCIVYTWGSRGAMLRLPFIARSVETRTMREKALVDLTPWQTAQALTAAAVTAEEVEYAREAERLADHEVDQAFASALRQATMQVQRRVLTGRALALSQRVDELQRLVQQDMAQLDRLIRESSAPAERKGTAAPEIEDNDVEIAKAQVQLDSDQLEDAQQELARASGDNRAQIQREHATREAAVRKCESEAQTSGPTAALAASRIGTLAGRLGAWNRQRTRYQLLQQAIQQAESDTRELTEQHNALETQTEEETGGTATGEGDRAVKLARIRDRSAESQLLAIYDDRIQTYHELVAVYKKWSEQVLRQRRIVQHLVVQSTALVLVILICMIVGARLVRRLMSHPSLDRRQIQTLRMILELSVQVFGVVLILFVVFGVPQQTPTILGLATAALTIALQDFIVSFLGWFRLVGKRGIRMGDWVEINTVAGEVVDIGLMTTTLLETGNRGYRTGRRITFMNSYAIRGQYFNFSTAGQWMWDELTVSLPASIDTKTTMKEVLEAVNEETGESARMAEQEWKRGTQSYELSKSRTDPAVNLRPSGSGVDIEIRYVTRASECLEIRNRLYRRILDLRNQPSSRVSPGDAILSA